MRDACRESDTAHRYVAGRLTADEAERFELHLLTCERCQAEVRLASRFAPVLSDQQAAKAVQRAPVDAAETRELAAPTPIASATPPGRGVRRARYVVPALAAAAVLAFIVMRSRSDLEGLAGVVPPVFSGAPLRSADARPADAGMAAYSSGDYGFAAVLLAEAAASDSSPSLAFYLGVSRLVTGDAKGALRALAVPRAAEGSPYRNDASFFAAKAHIRLRNADSAVAILRAIPETANGAARALALADSLRAKHR